MAMETPLHELAELRLARNPAAEPTHLARLADSAHDRVRACVARNPNTPLPELLGLWKKEPAAMLENSALVLHWLLEPQAFWKRFARGTLRDAYVAFMGRHCRVARPVWMDWDFIQFMIRGPLEQEVAATLAQEDSPRLRRIPLETPGFALREELLLRLAMDPEESIRLALLKIKQVPPAVQARLAHDPSPAVRLALAERATVAEALFLLSGDPEEAVRHAIQVNPSLMERTVLALWQMEEPARRLVLARHPHLGFGSQKLMAESKEPETWAGLLCHRNLEPGLRQQLTPLVQAEDRVNMLEFRLPTVLEWQRHRDCWSEEFRAALAAKAKVPLEILADLAGDESAVVRDSLRERLLDKKRSQATAWNKSLLDRLTEEV